MTKREQKNKQVRLVLHTSTLTGYDLKDSYEKNATTRFVKEFESFIDDANVENSDELEMYHKKVIIYKENTLNNR